MEESAVADISTLRAVLSSEAATSDVGAGQGCWPSSRGNIIDPQEAKRVAGCGDDASVASTLPLSDELSGL